jgi:hypothetical protein
MQMKQLSIIVATLALTAAMVCAAERDEEKPLKLAEVPAAVQKTILQHTSADSVRSLVRENEDGKIVYDVEFTKDGKKGEMDVAEDGKVIGTEEEITAKDLPAAVQKTLAAQTGKPGTIMKVLENGKTNYEIELHQVHEVIIDPDGKLVEPSAGKYKD